ncbi:hypothetical protein [Bacillus sp. FJAT-49736]|uniref:hypothetical protein n=1 Tax=Bacillus sp. FJAT-49736 TaxID=2833582 RepID=UPI001BC9F9CD|nr:hypothetical protein [Bacillus sp. FJAT-49736]MBS4172853.1 hypothetical protein [Bacillus sp. FJAT-49736]
MKSYRKYIMLILTMILLTSCSQPEQKEQKNAGLTIEPLFLNKKEQTLVSKTGVSSIEYFILNGHLKKNEDLKMELEKYVNGQNTNETMSSWDEPQRTFDNRILSFGVQSMHEGNGINLLIGLTEGLSRTSEPTNNIIASSQGNILREKVKLIKGKPVYLAAWVGSSKNEIQSVVQTEDWTLPTFIKESELAFVYKITIVDRKK